jgi:hypothetical protein
MMRTKLGVTALALGFCVLACGKTTAANDADVAAGTDAATEDVATGPVVWQTHPENTPRSVHLTWQHDPATSVTVQWATAALELGTYQPKAFFATEAVAGADGAKMPYDAQGTATGSGELYYQSLVTPTTDDPHWVTWTTELTGLQPDTAYVLRAGTWAGLTKSGIDQADLSDVMHFRTAPKKGTRQPFSAVLAGDSRGGAALIQANAERLAQMDASMWIFNGDFTTTGFQPDWDEWFDAMAPILNRRPLMPVLGNHEIFPSLFTGQFALPLTPGVPAELQELAWSTNWGNVHFVGLDSMVDSLAMAQVPWLDADLEAARKDPDIDWIVVMMHHPAYSAGNHGSTDYVQKYWSPLFDKHDVDLVFSGHDHSYERTVPIRGGKKVDKGPIYIVAGAFYVDQPYKVGKEWWTETSIKGDAFNYVKLDVDGKKLSWTAFSGDGATTLDSATLQK